MNRIYRNGFLARSARMRLTRPFFVSTPACVRLIVLWDSIYNHLSLKLDFASLKKGARPSRPFGDRYNCLHSSELKRTQTHTGGTPVPLCKNPKASCFCYYRRYRSFLWSGVFHFAELSNIPC